MDSPHDTPVSHCSLYLLGVSHCIDTTASWDTSSSSQRGHWDLVLLVPLLSQRVNNSEAEEYRTQKWLFSNSHVEDTLMVEGRVGCLKAGKTVPTISTVAFGNLASSSFLLGWTISVKKPRFLTSIYCWQSYVRFLRWEEKNLGMQMIFKMIWACVFSSDLEFLRGGKANSQWKRQREREREY